MKNISLVILSLVLITTYVNAQEFQGIATYKSHRKVDLKIETGDEKSEMKKQIQEQLSKQFQQEFTLKFNKYESVYKQEERLDAPMPAASGIRIQISQGSDLFYKNIKENKYAKATEIYGKQFLIKDSLLRKNWELVNETKNIGEYTCFKAILKEAYTTQTITETGEFEKVTKEKITTAWYTPQIPVNNGPSDYFGLPGLILEINDGELTLICSRIVINPEEAFIIEAPNKGKEVSQKEFDEVLEKKSAEMMEQFRTGRGASRDNMVIKIGG